MELTLEADGVLLQEDVRMLASLLTPAVEAQRQAQSNLYYVNLSQEVYFGQFGQFNQEIESLFYLLGEDQFYRYSLNKLEGQQAIIQTIAKPQQYDLRTYIGAVMALEDGEFAAIRCEAQAPGVMAAVPMAEFVEGEVLCPAGFREIL